MNASKAIRLSLYFKLSFKIILQFPSKVRVEEGLSPEKWFLFLGSI